MKKRILELMMVVMVFTLISNQITYAHSTLQSGTISWGELSGWSIHESLHTNSTSITYYYDTSDRNITDALKTTIRNGANKWSYYGTISESSSGTGKIHTFSDSITDTVALFYDQAADSSGHFTYWTIKFNRAKTITSVTTAHEFGHAYGLKDLTSTDNFDKLMLKYEERSATNPTTQDIKGFKVITGQHSYHYSWAYKAVTGYPASLAVHMRYCTTCDGYKIESCSPTIGTCTTCWRSH